MKHLLVEKCSISLRQRKDARGKKTARLCTGAGWRIAGREDRGFSQRRRATRTPQGGHQNLTAYLP
jgi:hypothetical protein